MLKIVIGILPCHKFLVLLLDYPQSKCNKLLFFVFPKRSNPLRNIPQTWFCRLANQSTPSGMWGTGSDWEEWSPTRPPAIAPSGLSSSSSSSSSSTNPKPGKWKSTFNVHVLSRSRFIVVFWVKIYFQFRLISPSKCDNYSLHTYYSFTTVIYMIIISNFNPNTE